MSIFRASLNYTVTGSDRPIVNILDVETAAGVFASAVADNVGIEWAANIMPALPSSLRLESVTVLDLETLSYGERAVGTPGGVTGTLTPPNTAYLVRKLLSAGPRKNFGRMYLPGVQEANVDDAGNINNAPFIEGLLNTFKSDVEALANPLNIGVAKKNPVTGVVTFTDMDAWSVQTKVATQRRRIRK